MSGVATPQLSSSSSTEGLLFLNSFDFVRTQGGGDSFATVAVPGPGSLTLPGLGSLGCLGYSRLRARAAVPTDDGNSPARGIHPRAGLLLTRTDDRPDRPEPLR